MFAKLALLATMLAGLAAQALAYNGKATSYAKAGQAINGGGTGFNVSAALRAGWGVDRRTQHVGRLRGG